MSGTVLIIEDDTKIAKWVKVYFERAGFSAEVAHDGESGLALARSLTPDLIILDLMLPRLDGVELCRILRRESEVPIIMLTAREAHAHRILELDSGADDYIVKPFDPEEVELERGVVLEQWRLSQGFYSRLQDNLLQLIFGSSLYAQRAPIGLPQVIESADAELLREYYERWYRPGLMAVIAVGDFDVEAMEAKVKQHFAPPPEGEAGQERAVAGAATSKPVVRIPGHTEPRIEVFTDAESPGTRVILIRKLAPDKGQTRTAFRRVLIERLAFRMLNVRLFERAQEADAPYLVADGGRSLYVERLWRTVKYEEVYLKAYASAGEARRELGAYFRFYNDQRPHQALGYRTPGEVFSEATALREEESKIRRCSPGPVSVSLAQVAGLSLNSAPILSN